MIKDRPKKFIDSGFDFVFSSNMSDWTSDKFRNKRERERDNYQKSKNNKTNEKYKIKKGNDVSHQGCYTRRDRSQNNKKI